MSDYDPLKFASMLKKAIGKRTAKQFAADTGLSRFQLSRRLSCQLTTPPRKKTLFLIASAAQNGVTYEQLLLSCGYGPDSKDDTFQRSPSGECKLAKASILSNIEDLGVSCRIEAEPKPHPCDFEITLDLEQPVTWEFTCIPSDTKPGLVQQLIDQSYLSLMYSRLQAYSKLSFVTGSQEIYNLCISRRPVNLNANVSAILFSPATLNIVSEQELSSSDEYPLPEGKASFEN